MSLPVTPTTESRFESEEKLDYVSKSMGAFGLWQFIYIFIGASTRCICTWNTMSIVFLAPETDFICIKFDDNTTTEVKNNTCYDTCVEYDYTSELFEETLISEFGLICKNTWLRSFVQTILMLGVLIGVSSFGWFSDRYGRKKGMILAGVTCSIFMLASPFCRNFWSLAAVRFFAGIGTGGYLALTGVYMSELVGSRMVDLVICSAVVLFDGAGLTIQVAFSYFTSTWRAFLKVSSSVTILIVCITFFLPETPRWLVAKGKETEAVELMTRAAKFNKRTTLSIEENVTNVTRNFKAKDKRATNLTYLDLFKTKTLTVWTTASVWMWFIAGFSYLGLIQYLSQFGSDVYVVVTTLGLVQSFRDHNMCNCYDYGITFLILITVVAAPLSILIVKYCGRRVSSICVYSTIGALSFVLIFISKESMTAVIVGCIGVVAASAAFPLVYILVIELFPTPMRNMGLSVSSVGSKVAGMVAPFVVNIHKEWIASSIFAAAGFSAVIICFLLPETKGKKLKDTVDDIQ